MDIGQLMNRTVKMEIENEESSFYSNSYMKKKRFRSAFTTDQINGLEKQYKRYPYIGIRNRKAIAKSLNIPEKAVKIWFQNRRMKEKRDKAHVNYEETHTAVNLVNDQSTNSSAIQSSNDPVSIQQHTFPPQTQSRTGLSREGGDKILKSYVEPVNNKTIMEMEKPDKNITKAIDNMTNDAVTSSTNDRNTLESTVEVVNKIKNNLHSTPERLRQKVFPKPRLEVTDKCKYNTHPKISRQTTHTPTSMPQHQTIPQIHARYVPPYTQDTQSHHSYQQACLPVGNVLWKPMEPNMTGVMPVNQFTLLPQPTAQNLSMPGRKCFCNCHGNSQQNPAYPQENQLPPPQYIFAVPFNNAPAHFTYPI